MKDGAHALKKALADYQIAAFVAHDDIEPTKEWQAEIESALRTMDGLAAILTADFVSSRWCDQEVGIAIGREKLVIPLRAGADPHGFLGKHQGLQIKGVSASKIAERLFNIVIRHDSSGPRLADSLIERLEKSKSWDSSRGTMTLLEKLPRLNRIQVSRLAQIPEANPEVKDAFTVAERIDTLIANIGQPDSA